MSFVQTITELITVTERLTLMMLNRVDLMGSNPDLAQ